MATLERASREWANRPADERFASLADLHAKAEEKRQRARTSTVPTDSLLPVLSDGSGTETSAPSTGDSIALQGRQSGIIAPLSHWAFGQLAKIAQAPADYLRSLPTAIVVDALKFGVIKHAGQQDPETRILFDQNGHATVRALTSTRYSRIFDSDITSRLIRLTEMRPEWQPAPAAFDGSRGLYMGDRDMFAFMVDNDRRIFETGPGGGLGRGFFAWNSEVGASTFGICTFLYEYVCGNHRVWGAKAVREMRVRHVGDADQRALGQFDVTVTAYADSAASREENLIGQAQRYRIADTKDEVLDRIFALRDPFLTRKVLADSYDVAEKHSDWYGDPRTAWGIAGGITELSQTKQYAGQRVDLDRAAGKVMDMAF